MSELKKAKIALLAMTITIVILGAWIVKVRIEADAIRAELDVIRQVRINKNRRYGGGTPQEMD